MKKLILFSLFLIPYICFSQNLIELLVQKKDSLNREIDNLNTQVKHTEAVIKKNAKEHGYPSVIINQINSEPTPLRVHPGFDGKIIRQLPVGEKIYVLGKGMQYFKVKIDGVKGFVSRYNVQNNDFIREMNQTQFKRPKIRKPSSRTSKTNTSNKSKKYSTPYKSSSSTSTKCNSTRCSGYTKKGNRCSRKTTSCSGRCYQH